MSDLKNLYTLARKGWKSENYKQSKKCYEEIMREDTDSWEATLYYYLSCAMLATLNEDFDKAIDLIDSCINPVFDLLENDKDFDEQPKHIKSTNDDLKTVISKTDLEVGRFSGRETKGLDYEDPVYRNAIKTCNARWQALKDIERAIKKRQQRLDDVVGKKRLEFFWANNQSLKEELETEKRTLENDIKTFEKDITEIPSKDVEYNRLTELSNLLENQKAEKKSLGLFGWLLKSKANKEIKQKIKDTKSQINPIQARIDAAILEVNGRIDEKKKRIVEIEQEFAKPR